MAAEPVQRLAAVEKCIYCGSTDQLSDEHIMPQSMGGRVILPKASCEVCRRKTEKFERVVARTMYWPLRLKIGIKGKRHHKRPTHWLAEIDDVEGEKVERRALPVQEIPTAYIVAEMPPAGMFTGEPPSDGSPAMQIHMKGNKAELARMAESLGVGRWELTQNFHWGAFSLMLAKIAHAWAAAQVGVDTFEHLLAPLIRGEAHYYRWLIGGRGPTSEVLTPPNDLALCVHIIDGKPMLLVHMTFFGHRFPIYTVIVGRLLAEPGRELLRA
jgi:hypothetical protein